MTDRPLRILFNVRHLGYARHYEGLVNDLSAAGHQVQLVTQPAREPESARLLRSLDSLPGIEIIGRDETERGVFVESLRALRNYLRYLEPEFEGTDALEARAARRVPRLARRWFENTRGRPSRRRRVAERVARFFDELSPPTDEATRFVEEFDPDVVLVTPLVDLGGGGGEFVKAARAARKPCALMVASWDNLTNKGKMPVVPDRVVLWNEAQRDEAVRLHDVPEDHVIVTGAQTFDEWFERKPARTSDEFLHDVGGIPGRPTILYLISSGFIGGTGPGEHEFVADWAAAIRSSSDPVLRDANIIIRPHPKVPADPLHALAETYSLKVWPPSSTFVIGEQARQDYVDQLALADVAVGLNTSASIEAVIMGCPVLTVLDPRFRLAMEGTIHFGYLRDGGALEVDETLAEHIPRLSAIVNGRPRDEARRERFLKWFVRPYGLDQPAAPRLVDAVVSLPTARSEGRKPRRWMRPLVAIGTKLLLLYPEIRYNEQRLREKTLVEQQQRPSIAELGRRDRKKRRREKQLRRQKKEGIDAKSGS